MKQRVVVLTGAGISAESGLGTFRGSDGLWEGYDVRDVATPEAWERNPGLVQRFYNERRKSVLDAQPNAAHRALAELEQAAEVTIITQNIDDLHERAGSRKVVHLHGEILKARSSVDEALVYDVEGWEIRMGQRCERGSQLRPHIVWFGEAVPMMEFAAQCAISADIFLVVGTSLLVYPAAGLVDFVPQRAPIVVIDPSPPQVSGRKNVSYLAQSAAAGVPEWCQSLSSRNSFSKTGGPTSA